MQFSSRCRRAGGVPTLTAGDVTRPQSSDGLRRGVDDVTLLDTMSPKRENAGKWNQ